MTNDAWRKTLLRRKNPPTRWRLDPLNVLRVPHPTLPQARAAQQPPDIRAKFGPRSAWSALKGATLATARENRVRHVVPFYTLDQEIRLPDGKLLYPIDETMSQWHLEGSGDKRVLILDLENTHAGIDWSKGLLVVGVFIIE